MNSIHRPALTKTDRRMVNAVAGLQLHAAPDGDLVWGLSIAPALAVRLGVYPATSAIEACTRAAALCDRLAVELQQS